MSTQSNVIGEPVSYITGWFRYRYGRNTHNRYCGWDCPDSCRKNWRKPKNSKPKGKKPDKVSVKNFNPISES